MKREEAEEVLQPRKQGLFLVRESNNYPGDYTLCVVSPVSPLRTQSNTTIFSMKTTSSL